jgi:hypothetical protein
MTQAFNLSQLANKVNTSGQLNGSNGLSGVVPIANGGTGLSAVGTSGNVLTSNGSAWVSSAPATPTIADGSVTDPKISDTVTAGSNWVPIQGAMFQIYRAPNYTTLTKIAESFMYRGGVFNVRLKLYNGNTGPDPGTKTLYARIYRSGVAISSEVSVSVAINTMSAFISFNNLTMSGQGMFQVYVRGPGLDYVLGIADTQIGVSSPLKIAPIANLGQTTFS